MIWVADAGWAWVAATNYRQRPIWVGRALQAFLLFMAINGAILFADGPTRPAGIAALGLLGLLLLRAVPGKNGQ